MLLIQVARDGTSVHLLGPQHPFGHTRVSLAREPRLRLARGRRGELSVGVTRSWNRDAGTVVAAAVRARGAKCGPHFGPHFVRAAGLRAGLRSCGREQKRVARAPYALGVVAVASRRRARTLGVRSVGHTLPHFVCVLTRGRLEGVRARADKSGAGAPRAWRRRGGVTAACARARGVKCGPTLRGPKTQVARE